MNALRRAASAAVRPASLMRWFPIVLQNAGGRRHVLPLDLTATVRTRPDDESECMEVSVQGWMAVDPAATARAHRPGATRSSVATLDGARIDACRRSAGRLANAEPFTWIQVVDDRGAPLTGETFLGQGIGMRCRVHARVQVEVLAAPAAPSAPPGNGTAAKRVGVEIASGVHARLLLRTYRNPTGPLFHTEAIVLPLLAAGHHLRVPSSWATCPSVSSLRTG